MSTFAASTINYISSCRSGAELNFCGDWDSIRPIKILASRGLLGVATLDASMDIDEQLIECARELPCLWKTHLKSYKDQMAKENAWKGVSEQV